MSSLRRQAIVAQLQYWKDDASINTHYTRARKQLLYTLIRDAFKVSFLNKKNPTLNSKMIASVSTSDVSVAGDDATTDVTGEGTAAVTSSSANAGDESTKKMEELDNNADLPKYLFFEIDCGGFNNIRMVSNWTSHEI
jgi:hypothetical protein